MPKKKKLILLILFTMIVVCVGIAGSYALWSITLNQANENIVSTSCFDITFEEDTSTTIKLEKAFPISDEDGANLKPYKFKIKNNCSSYVKYTLAIEVTKSSTLDSGFLKYQLNNEKGSLIIRKNSIQELKDKFISDAEPIVFDEEEAKEYIKKYEKSLKITEENSKIDIEIFFTLKEDITAYQEIPEVVEEES